MAQKTQQGEPEIDVSALLNLAKNRSQAARSELAGNIKDFFLNEEARLSERERAIMSDILIKLVHEIETDVRKELAQTIAKVDADMPELLKLLGSDDISIATPILQQCKALRDIDLIEIVKMRTDEHRMLIALREDVTEAVSDALVESAGDDVIEALVRNDDAELSRRAMQYLVAESKRKDRFQEPLLSRDDLPAELAYRMYWWVAAALRKRILNDFDVAEDVIDEAIQVSAKRAAAQQDEVNGAITKATQLVRRLDAVGQLTIEFLIRTLRQQRINVFVAGLALRSGVAFKTAWRIISDKGFESFIVLAKATGIDRNEATVIVLLLAEAQNPAAARRPEVLNSIIDLYNSISVEKARGVLQVWQRDLGYADAIAKVDANG
ncbi:MAG: DUF2336 domain-containing protein [Pseudomonadota bacterium]